MSEDRSEYYECRSVSEDPPWRDELKMIKSIERQIKIVKLLILISYLYELQKARQKLLSCSAARLYASLMAGEDRVRTLTLDKTVFQSYIIFGVL